MEALYRRSNSALQGLRTKYQRPLLHEIDWQDPLIVLLGPRGIGKTTLLLQRLRQLDLPPQKGIYIDLGDLYFQANRLIDFAEAFIEQGGTHLFIDEVHRYGFSTWSAEIKQLYDLYRHRVQIVITGSSVIKILHEQADLSRRALKYKMVGLSFREYLNLTYGLQLSPLTIPELLTNTTTLANELITSDLFRPREELVAYWTFGYYPFHLERRSGFTSRLADTVQTVLEHDIPYGTTSSAGDATKIGRLLYAIASSAPFTPNIQKLAERTQISRPTLLQYLIQLENAHLIATLRKDGKGVSTLSKPDKIFLDNPNLVTALAPNQVDIGTLHETFLLNQLRQTTHGQQLVSPQIKLPSRGDFLYQFQEASITFEVGGPNKSEQQLNGSKDGYLVVDVEQSGHPRKIPLWLVGFLY